MVSFLELAPELLDTIVSYVAVDDPTQIGLLKSTTGDLASLASTCRDLYQLAITHLYRLFNQTENYGNPNQLSQFLKTILDRPELAAKVQKLHLMPYSGHRGKDKCKEDTKGKPSANDTFITALQAMPWWQTWNEINDPRAQEWIDAIKAQTNTNPLCGILLLSVPNLQHIMFEITRSSIDPVFFVEAVEEGVHFDAESSVPRFFSNLTELDIFTDSLNFNVERVEMEDFLPIPSLKRCQVSQLCADFSNNEPPSYGYYIESLELPRSKVKSWEKLLGPMKNLKNLDFTPLCMRDEDNIHEDASEIGRALMLVRDTLESLELEEFNTATSSDQLSLLGSLKDFPKLRTLHIQLGLLIGTIGIRADTKELWELLPCNIEELTLMGQINWYSSVGNKEDCVDQITKVVVMRNSHFPQLQKLSVDGFSDEDGEKLKEVCVIYNFYGLCQSKRK